MKNKKIWIYIASSSFFFLFLLYNMFPYLLVKEVLINQIQIGLQNTPLHLTVEADKLNPYWFTGVELKGIHVRDLQDSTAPIEIKRLTARVSFFPLLIGNIKVNVSLIQKEGDADFSISLPLFSVIAGNPHLKRLEAEFSDFPLDDVISQMKASLGKQKDMTTAFIFPVIANAKAGGYLNGNIDFINSGATKSAQVDLIIKKGYLNINNKNLNIPNQNFSAAGLHLTWDGNAIEVQKGSQMVSENIFFGAKGSLKGSLGDGIPMQANLRLDIKMSGEIEKNFGFLLPQILKCPDGVVSKGNMNIQLIGPVNQLVCQ